MNSFNFSKVQKINYKLFSEQFSGKKNPTRPISLSLSTTMTKTFQNIFSLSSSLFWKIGAHQKPEKLFAIYFLQNLCNPKKQPTI